MTETSSLVRALNGICDSIDALNEFVGRCVSWLTVLIVLTVFTVVVLRYVFSIGFIWMQEIYVWFYGAVFMIGAGYTLLHDEHVRIDLIYRDAGPRYKAVVNVLGSVFLGLPLVWVLFQKGYPFVVRSWAQLERSAEAGGLPGVYLLKSVVVLFCIFLGLQLISLALRNLLVLFGVPPSPEDAKGEGVV